MAGFAPVASLPLGGLPTATVPATLIADNGHFALTGEAINFTSTLKIAAACGSFALAGQAINFTLSTAANFALTAFYRLTGQDAEFSVSKTWTKQDCTDSTWVKADQDCNCE